MSTVKKFSVLIADESRSMLINLKAILKNKFPCEQIVPCRDGAEAWENIKKQNLTSSFQILCCP